MSEVSPRGRALLAEARAARPSAEARARISAALAAELGAAAIGATAIGAAAIGTQRAGAAPSPPALPAAPPIASMPGAGAAIVAGPVVKVLAVGALLGAVALGGALLRPSRPAISARDQRPIETNPATSVEPRAAAVASAIEVPTALPPDAPPIVEERAIEPPIARQLPAKTPRAPRDPDLGAQPSRGAPEVSPAPPRPRAEGSLAEEVTLLQRAQKALKQGDGSGSIAALDELAARHPDGALREERITLMVLALCSVGRVGEARAAARHFVDELPGSVQAERLRASCAFSPRKDR